MNPGSPDAPDAPETDGPTHVAPMDEEGTGDSLRRCIASGESLPPDKMIRFVIGPDDFVVPDLSQKLPGRGCWVTSSRDAVRKAIERDLFSKAAKRKVKCAPDLDVLIEGLLVRRCCDLLGFTRRAGIVISGFAKVELMVRDKAGRIAALVEGSDSGAADRGKLFGYARKNRSIRVVGNLTQAEIGLAFGRENVVHAALTQSPLADRFISEAERLGGFRVLCPTEWDLA